MIWFMIILFFIMIFMGIPIAFSMGLSALMFFIVEGIPLSLAVQRFFSNTQSFPFLAIPFFILAGQIMIQGGIAKRIIKLADSLIGPLPGGLALVSIVTSMIMAGCSGSSVADASGVGSVLIPSMKEKGYGSSFSCVINATSSVVGIIIPPSCTMVILAWITNLSVAKLFLGGAIPGILISIVYFIITIFISVKRKYPRGKFLNLKKIIGNLINSSFAIILPFFIIGGIIFGIATVTEIAAVSAVYSFLVSVFIYRSLNFEKIMKALKDTTYATTVVMMIVCASNIFTWVLIYGNLPKVISSTLLNFGLSDSMMIFVFILIMLLFGTFMDLVPNLFLLIPVFFPIAKAIGVDEIQFGVLMVVTLALGMFTPPVGVTLYISCHIAKIGLEDTILDLIPYFLGGVFVCLLVAYYPPITLLLPELLFK